MLTVEECSNKLVLRLNWRLLPKGFRKLNAASTVFLQHYFNFLFHLYKSYSSYSRLRTHLLAKQNSKMISLSFCSRFNVQQLNIVQIDCRMLFEPFYRTRPGFSCRWLNEQVPNNRCIVDWYKHQLLSHIAAHYYNVGLVAWAWLDEFKIPLSVTNWIECNLHGYKKTRIQSVIASELLGTFSKCSQFLPYFM